MENALIELNNIEKTYGKQKALNNISFYLEKGKIYGLLGENGAGKTTLMRIIAGLSFPTSGSIKLFGKCNPKAIERKNIGFLIENPSAYPNKTAYDNLVMFYKLKKLKIDSSINELLKLVKLSCNDNKKVKDFSLGMKQRLGIAIALIGSPQVLILDEPINGLDPKGISEVRLLMKRLVKNYNKTILISSHNLSEIYNLATNYIFIHKGNLVSNMTQQELEDNLKNRQKIVLQDNQQIQKILENFKYNTDYTINKNGEIEVYNHLKAFKDKLIKYDGYLKYDEKSINLEQLYFILTEGD